jgi:Tol biopolymer transport system component
MDIDGANVTNLTNNLANEDAPAWSPDGSRIAFASDRDGDNFEIYVMDADGANVTRLTDNPAEDDSPSWTSVP